MRPVLPEQQTSSGVDLLEVRIRNPLRRKLSETGICPRPLQCVIWGSVPAIGRKFAAPIRGLADKWRQRAADAVINESETPRLAPRYTYCANRRARCPS